MSPKELIDNLLQKGSVGIIPTDTVYGIVARAEDKKAVLRLYKLKKRSRKPGTIIALDINQVVKLGIKRSYLSPFKTYWPNPLSVIIPTSNPKLTYLHQGIGSLAIRITKDKFLRKILLETGPLLTSSANQPNLNPAKNILEAKNYFLDKVDFYYDAGKNLKNKPSTIIKVIDDSVQIIRQGDFIFKP